MIEYYVNEEKQTVTAVMRGCAEDAMNVIKKRCKPIGMEPHFYKWVHGGFYPIENAKQYAMADTYKAVVKPHGSDVFSVEEGKRQAKDKLLNNYHAALDKRVNRFFDNFYNKFYR